MATFPKLAHILAELSDQQKDCVQNKSSQTHFTGVCLEVEFMRRDIRLNKCKYTLPIYKAEGNARTHNKEQIMQIANSMMENGWTAPMLIDENDMILAGHGRKAAGEMLGVEEVPVMIIRGLNPAQKARLCISENQIALNAGWDTNKLSEQLQLILDDGLDLEITGFDDDFLNDILKLDNDNELLDPLEGEKEEKVQANKFLSFGSYKIHISEEEYQSLVDAYENFVKKNGVRYGFVAKVLLPQC